MDVGALLRDAFERVQGGFRRVTEDLDADALGFRPDPAANSIAWLLWHATRVHDDHVSEIADRPQAWEEWIDRLGLPFDPHDTGYGHSAEQVGLVRVDDADLLLGYHDDVAGRTYEYLSTVTPGDLDRIIDYGWDPPVSVGVRLISVINDQMQHLGQAAYIRGLYQRTVT